MKEIEEIKKDRGKERNKFVVISFICITSKNDD